MKESILEIIETLETEGKPLNEAQQEFLFKNFNHHFRFTYAEGHLCYMFSMSEKEYNAMEYYLGWEYERESRELYCNYEGKVIASYHLGDRITDVMYALEKLEKETSVKE